MLNKLKKMLKRNNNRKSQYQKKIKKQYMKKIAYKLLLKIIMVKKKIKRKKIKNLRMKQKKKMKMFIMKEIINSIKEKLKNKKNIEDSFKRNHHCVMLLQFIQLQ